MRHIVSRAGIEWRDGIKPIASGSKVELKYRASKSGDLCRDKICDRKNRAYFGSAPFNFRVDIRSLP